MSQPTREDEPEPCWYLSINFQKLYVTYAVRLHQRHRPGDKKNPLQRKNAGGACAAI